MSKITTEYYVYELKKLKEHLDSTARGLEQLSTTIEVLLDYYSIDVERNEKLKEITK